MIWVSWSDFKTRISGKQWRAVDKDTFYYLSCADSAGDFETTILKTTPASSDQTDYETNYASKANKATPLITAPFSSKIIEGGKKLFKRMHGIQQAVTTGSNTITYTIPYAWVKMIGCEIVNCEALDYVSMQIVDTPAGTYSGVPNYLLNGYGYTVNTPKDYYSNKSNFDADLYVGMVIKLTYVSVGNKTVGINFDLNEVV